MGPFEIILIIACVLIVVGVFSWMIYKKIKHEPTCGCGCGGHKGKKILKQYHKKYQDKDSHSCCCCHCHDEQGNDSNESCCCHDADKTTK